MLLRVNHVVLGRPIRGGTDRLPFARPNAANGPSRIQNKSKTDGYEMASDVLRRAPGIHSSPPLNPRPVLEPSHVRLQGKITGLAAGRLAVWAAFGSRL